MLNVVQVVKAMQEYKQWAGTFECIASSYLVVFAMEVLGFGLHLHKRPEFYVCAGTEQGQRSSTADASGQPEASTCGM